MYSPFELKDNSVFQSIFLNLQSRLRWREFIVLSDWLAVLLGSNTFSLYSILSHDFRQVGTFLNFTC